MEQDLNSFCKYLLDISKSNIPVVVVTLTEVRGSAPQDVGARMIVSDRGIEFGTVGGGKIEAHCIDLSKKMLIQGEKISKSYKWNLQKDIGMTCGGEVTLFFEVVNEKKDWNITIFGAGHISQELTRVLLRLDCNLTVVDNRKEWIDKLPDNSKLNKILASDMSEVVSTLSDNSFVALMTMGHALDVPILYKSLKERKFPFLGVIGSLVKRKSMERELLDRGLSSKQISSFTCPLGEKIGSNAPSEIAISITSQLLRVRDSLNLS